MRFKITEIINPRGCWRFWKPPNFSLKVRWGRHPLYWYEEREKGLLSHGPGKGRIEGARWPRRSADDTKKRRKTLTLFSHHLTSLDFWGNEILSFFPPLIFSFMQTLGSIAAEKNSTIIFPVPIDFITNFAFSGGGGPRQQQQQQQQPLQQQQQQQQHCPHPVQYQVASEAQGPEKKVKHYQKSGLNRFSPTFFIV